MEHRYLKISKSGPAVSVERVIILDERSALVARLINSVVQEVLHILFNIIYLCV